ncbi:hypothetical protein BDR04DRAFT_597530 [Suillus decipiens]|nr:hypothetical protein BDR04DRAFT_597530 [Suillus decipiens]
MLPYFGRHALALKVIAATNLPILSTPRSPMPTGHFVHVSTSNGQWDTTIKAAMTDRSVSWNETLTIYERPPTFALYLLSTFSGGKSKAINLEIYASYESGLTELVGTFETTFGQVLVSDVQSISCTADGNRSISLKLKAQRIKITQLVDHAVRGTAESSAAYRSVHLPAVGQSIDTTGHLPPSLSTHASSRNVETSPWGRNIVIFGQTGTGKSSIINAIAREQLAGTSNDAAGCTSGYKRHPVTISGQRFVLFDTAGLGEGPAGTVPDKEAKRQLKSLLRQLMNSRSPSDGIGLLKKIPIVIVITGLEQEPNMESWWDQNKDKLKSMHFTGHACVTALQEHPGNSEDFTRRIAESRDILSNLLVGNCSRGAVNDNPSNHIAGMWCASSSWSKD